MSKITLRPRAEYTITVTGAQLAMLLAAIEFVKEREHHVGVKRHYFERLGLLKQKLEDAAI